MNPEGNKNLGRFEMYNDKFNNDIEANEARQILQKENSKLEEKTIVFLKDLMETLTELDNKVAEFKQLIEEFKKANKGDLTDGDNDKKSNLDS